MPENHSFFDQHLAQTTPFPFGLEIERAEGVWLYEPSGKRYMDLISGVGVSALGHGHPKVIKAIKDQAEKHLHVMVYGEFMQAPQRELAQKLTSLLSSSLDTCYFVNSGAEAIEAALKLAKRVTGRSKLVSCRGAYHGSTHGAMSVSGNEVKKQAFRPLLPDVYFMTFNDFSSLDLIDNNTAGVVIETVQGDAGVRIPSKEWIQALRKRCTDHGVLLILDEIQAGLGRTGKLFAFEHFDIVPDILVLGKALGAGMPIGAIVASKHHMAQFTTDPMLGHITTFGGHPLICAAAKAGLDVLTEDVDLNLINQRGRKLADTLRKHPKVKEVRQIGYYFAIDMETRADVEYVVNYGMAHGYIGFWFLSCPNSFRIAPPLVISDEELSWAEDQLINALNGLR